MKIKNVSIKERSSKSSYSESVTDSYFYKNIETTINKWLNLQKIIKESQSLEKIIEKQHKDNFEQMKKYIDEFYNLKLKARKLYEDIKFLKKRTEWVFLSSEQEYYLTEASGTYFGNALTPIKNIISIIREHYDYIPILISLIDEKDTKQDVESFAEFLCNQFYTNILIPNPEQEELLICIFKLLEYEINKMNFVDVEFFLDDSTFIGKLLTAFSKQQELNNFIVNLLSKVLNEIDKRFNLLLELSLNDIVEYVKNRKTSESSENNININDQLEKFSSRCTYALNSKNINNIAKNGTDESAFYKIPNTKINFKKKKVLEEEIFRESIFSDNELNASMFLYEDDEIIFDRQDEDSSSNTDYNIELTKEILYQKIKNSSNPDLTELYNHLIYELDEIYHNPKAFGNFAFFQTLSKDEYKENKKQVIKFYLKIFLFIQEQIEDIIQSLIDKITTIPYATRCICTMINTLIKKKFPSLPKYFRHSFIGKFLFNKCIFPVLSLENANGLKTNLFTSNQMNCIKCIISVISNANMCKLFDIYNDVEKTMFNCYLLEIIPILNKFYDKLVSMTLPTQLNDFIEQSSYNSIIKEESTFLFNEKKNKIENDKKIEKFQLIDKYDYFKENSDEIFRLESVCFNEKNIIFIKNLLNKNTNAFKNLPDFTRVQKALKEKVITNLEKIISQQKENRIKKKLENTVGEGYYIFFYDEKNNIFTQFKNEKNKEKIEDKSLLFRIKNSIKTIMRRLNVLNMKQYSYLNFATSNEKFFLAINYTLKDLEGDDTFNDIKVPLSWHSKFIVNNLNQLDQKYIANDYEKLYEEILSEETEFLNKLKTISPIINVRESMNISCAENAIDNLEFLINSLEKTKKQEKIKIFIDNDKTKVCIDFGDDGNNRNDNTETPRSKSKYEKQKNNNINQKKYFRLTTVNNCIHNSMKFYAEPDNKIESHVEGINNFIYKLKNSEEGNFGQLRNFIKKDIENGKANHKIHLIFEDYKNILSKKLIDDYQDFIKEEKDSIEMMNKIEDYILQRTYKYLFPPKCLAEDKPFCELTMGYDWIGSTYFGVKIDLPLEAIQDSIAFVKLMEEKAFSINEKMKYFRKILDNINKINEFYCGVTGKTADDQTPIYTYIILKSHPKRFISNINYVKCFTDGNKIKEPDIELFKNNSIISLTKILEITAASFNITQEEFDKRKNESREKYNILYQK